MAAKLKGVANGITAILDANRFNEVESPTPRYTFGQMRLDAMGGHLTMDLESNIRLKRLGEDAVDVQYERANVNFASDCVYAVQRHFVDCMLSGAEFEGNGENYLKTLRVVDAVYESAGKRQVVRV